MILGSNEFHMALTRLLDMLTFNGDIPSIFIQMAQPMRYEAAPLIIQNNHIILSNERECPWTTERHGIELVLVLDWLKLHEKRTGGQSPPHLCVF